MKLKNKFFPALLITQLLLIDLSFAKVMTLTEVTQAAVKQNLTIKEKLIESHQSQQTVQYNRLSLLPKIDLYSIVNTGGSFFGLAGLIEDIAPFLIPANWFRKDEAEISLSFQKKSYKALWGNEVLEARSMYLTMVSDSKSLAVFDSYQKDLAELQDLAETRDQFGGDRLGALEMLLAQKSKVAEDQITLQDVINQEFYALTQMTQLDPKIHFDVDLNAKVESSWRFLDVNYLISSAQTLSPEVRSFDDLIDFLAQIKKEIKFLFFGTSTLSQGVAGGVFDDIPINGGWGFSTKSAIAMTNTKKELLKTQQLGARETLKRQILRSFDQDRLLNEKEKNMNERIVHLGKQWEILLDRLQFGKNAAMDELILNRQSLAETQIALIHLKILRSQLNDKVQRMLWWDVYSQFPNKY